jgi:hypothetical protein
MTSTIVCSTVVAVVRYITHACCHAVADPSIVSACGSSIEQAHIFAKDLRSHTWPLHFRWRHILEPIRYTKLVERLGIAGIGRVGLFMRLDVHQEQFVDIGIAENESPRQHVHQTL